MWKWVWKCRRKPVLTDDMKTDGCSDAERTNFCAADQSLWDGIIVASLLHFSPTFKNQWVCSVLWPQGAVMSPFNSLAEVRPGEKKKHQKTAEQMKQGWNGGSLPQSCKGRSFIGGSALRFPPPSFLHDVLSVLFHFSKNPTEVLTLRPVSLTWLRPSPFTCFLIRLNSFINWQLGHMTCTRLHALICFSDGCFCPFDCRVFIYMKETRSNLQQQNKTTLKRFSEERKTNKKSVFYLTFWSSTPELHVFRGGTKHRSAWRVWSLWSLW